MPLCLLIAASGTVQRQHYSNTTATQQQHNSNTTATATATATQQQHNSNTTATVQLTTKRLPPKLTPQIIP